MIFVFRVFAVAVYAQVVGRQSAIALLTVASTHFLGLITQVHFVQHIHERCKLAANWVDRVNTVADGDEANALLSKVNFRVKTCFHIVTPDATQVFRDDDADKSRVNVRNQLLPSGAFKVAAAVTVVCVMAAVRKTVLVSIVGQVRFLVRDGIGLTLQFIITGQTLIQRCDLGFIVVQVHYLPVSHSRLENFPSPIGQNSTSFGTVFEISFLEIMTFSVFAV